MATQRIAWSSSGSPYVSFYLDADVVETQPAPAGAGYGRWRIRYYLRMSKGSSSFYGGSGVQAGRGNGVEFGRHSGDPFLPSGTTSWNDGPWDVWVNANSSGYWSGSSTTYPLEMHLVYGSVAQVAYGSISLARLSTVPGAPPAPKFVSATGSSIDFTISGPSYNGGLPILDYEMQVSTSSSFSTITKTWSSPSSAQTVDGLNPGTTYYVRYRARNAAGKGGWSPTTSMSTLFLPGAPPAAAFSSATARSINFTISPPSSTGGNPILDYEIQVGTSATFSTLVKSWTSTSLSHSVGNLNPSTSYSVRYRARTKVGKGGWSPTATMSTQALTPPTISILTTPSGTGATATMTPTGSTIPDRYDVQYEYLSPAPIPSPAVVNTSTTSSSVTVSGMKPGATYRWRARSASGSFLSAYSAWQTQTQPAPVVSAGDYFDGSTAPADDQTFSWKGTANNSISEANGVGVSGWAAPLGVGTGSTIRLQRVRGGRDGTYAARMLVLADAVAAGLYIGMDFTSTANSAAVAENVVYFGSMFVRPSRPQAMQVEIVWKNSSGVEVTRDVGPSVLVSDMVGWTRLVVEATAPLGAVAATVRARDAETEGWTPWLSGEWLDADSVMVTQGELYPYFDGSTPDSGVHAYAWTGGVNASASVRTDIDTSTSAEDLLIDPDCPPVPAAPLPPVIASSCIEEVGIWRRYWVSVPATEVATWKKVVPTIELRTGLFDARQVRIRAYSNPFGYTPDNLDLTDWCSEQIVSFIPSGTLFTLDGIMERAWAEVQGRAAVAADHLLYGTGGVPATWPELSCGIGYTFSLDVPLDAPESNLDISMSLTARE